MSKHNTASDLNDNLDLNLNKDQNQTEENKKNKKNSESVSFNVNKIDLTKKLLLNIKENTERLIDLFAGTITAEEESRISIAQMASEETGTSDEQPEIVTPGRIIEGVFDGENMIGPDGKQYSVPANYASKSKLVEGDILKLTITPNGTFVYKQIGPIDRSRLVGILEQVSNGNYSVLADGKRWRVLTASVTYFKGQIGDETVILIPKTGESKWAAVENVVRKSK